MNERQVLDALLGVYVGVILVTAGVLVSWEFGTDRLPVSTLVVTGAVIAAVVTAAARGVEDLADRVASIPVAAVTVGIPLVFLPYMLLITEPESEAMMGALVGLLAVVPGICIPLGGGLITNKRRRGRATEIVAVTVGDDDDDGSQLETTAIALVGIVVGGILIGGGIMVALGFDPDTSTIITSLTGVATSLLVFADGDSEIAVTDAGLIVDQQFLQWDDLTGYRLTDETVEIITPTWYQPTREFDREEISDEDALIEGLNEFLPRVDEHGRVELSPRRA
ncbi:MAG: hypothetical protein ACOCP2_02420 [Halohasta sp.]